MLRMTATPAPVPEPTALDWFNAAAGALGALGSIGVAAVGAAVAWQVHKYRQERDQQADDAAALESRREFARRFNDELMPVANEMVKADGQKGRDAIRGRMVPLIDATAGYDDKRLQLVQWWINFAEAYGSAETQTERIKFHTNIGLLTSSWVSTADVPAYVDGAIAALGKPSS